jgi:hypothetical protein
MFERFGRDETGMALGLAVIMIVLIGVMGAGLLVFVRNDLEAVVEVNQGHRAMDLADAGAQVGKAQLLADNVPAHYDVDSLLSQVFNDPLCNIDSSDATRAAGELIARNPSAESWSPESGGQERDFAGGRFDVTIRWMTPLPLAPSDCRAPRTSLTGILPGGTEYFKVVSTGTYKKATRKVEVIYETYDLHVPKAYYTPGPITVGGDACIDSVSLFSLSDVTFNGTGGCRNALGVKMNTHMKGQDRAYGDWNDPPLDKFNRTGRRNALGVRVTDAGVGAVGTIFGSSTRKGTRDYDATTTPRFVQAPSANPQGTNEITFPFDLGSQPDASRLCDQAKAQENYIRDNSTGIANLNIWPDPSYDTTVVCYDFTNPTSTTELRWALDGATDITTGSYKGCKQPKKRGTLVVRGGGFTIKPKTALFEGVVVVRGPADQESEISNTDETGLSGNTCLDGFVNSTGSINITGTVTPSGSVEVNNRPGFYGVRTWSWRELYE